MNPETSRPRGAIPIPATARLLRLNRAVYAATGRSGAVHEYIDLPLLSNPPGRALFNQSAQ